MKNLKLTTLLIFAFCLVSVGLKADVFDDIASAIRAGNASAVAAYFDNTVELKVIDKSSVYSRNQGEIVLRDFFNSNQPKSFSVIHRGSSAKGARYAIGTLETAAGSLRVYMYIKDESGRPVIQELSFEKE